MTLLTCSVVSHYMNSSDTLDHWIRPAGSQGYDKTTASSYRAARRREGTASLKKLCTTSFTSAGFAIFGKCPNPRRIMAVV